MSEEERVKRKVEKSGVDQGNRRVKVNEEKNGKRNEEGKSRREKSLHGYPSPIYLVECKYVP